MLPLLLPALPTLTGIRVLAWAVISWAAALPPTATLALNAGVVLCTCNIEA